MMAVVLLLDVQNFVLTTPKFGQAAIQWNFTGAEIYFNLTSNTR